MWCHDPKVSRSELILYEGVTEYLAPSPRGVCLVEVKLIMNYMEPGASLWQILTDSKQVKL